MIILGWGAQGRAAGRARAAAHYSLGAVSFGCAWRVASLLLPVATGGLTLGRRNRPPTERQAQNNASIPSR
jgi:hypothetical protein